MPYKIFTVIPVELEIPVEHPTMDEARDELKRLQLQCPEDTFLIKEVQETNTSNKNLRP